MNDLASDIAAAGTLGIEGYQLSEGVPVSTTLGPGGASLIQTGAAASQTTFTIIAVILAIAVIGYLLVR